jgi:predicted deacylase
VAQDRIDGTPVIASLDAAALPAGGVHRFWLRAGTSAVGQGWYVPVIVIRGAKPGPRLLLTAAIHGDELNGIAVIHRLAAEIDPATLAGTLVMLPGLNTPGLMGEAREFTSTPGFAQANLNRIMPGKADGDSADRYAAVLWSVMRPNADLAVDLHTQSRGTAYVMYAFAATPAALDIARAVGPDVIKLDPGVRGTVENTLVDDGVPAITLELGYPQVFDRVMIGRATDGIKRLMAAKGMIAATLPPATVTPYVANALVNARVQHGGFATLLVALNQDVAKGQPIVTVADPFGRVIETVTAPVAGRVNSVATNPLREPGDMVVRIVYHSDDPKCAAGC